MIYLVFLSYQSSHKSWRPASVLSLRLSHKLYGLNPKGFHLDNVSLHVAITYCYSLLCFRLTESYMDGKGIMARTTAILASALFTVHPVHTEPVASVVGEKRWRNYYSTFFHVV